ncbi:MAG TPA: LysM peptidoglycan-binding domain-containing protein [Candidatus Coprenecus stercoravium]|uniref:LysM peptidoglycan-binding domain-containing protein n=1 Tax=Candidatus Coprenecus stercoravium TaxID=2840735 RepID=A0A9D2KAC9_9BACT|nr:LysM peptidoglycan-binding domain-containing protein [Candidatus Coprenecus stercoravium]
MRLLRTATLCLIMALTGLCEASAQEFIPTPVEISKDKANINGSIYYVHKVLKGQTLYSISKAYGVDISELQKVNPSVSEGLKTGALLYIPVIQTSAPEQKPAPQKPVSKKLKKYRPKWYETLDDVAVKFNTSVDAIKAVNPDLNEGKRIRVLYIPERTEEAENTATVTPQKETSAVNKDTVRTQYAPVGVISPEHDTTAEMYDDSIYRISVVLPFNAARLTDGINAYTADFYAGILTAASILKEDGLFGNFAIDAVDLTEYGSSWEMTASGVLSNSALIIGPISERDLQPVASFARSRHIPTVSPLDIRTTALADGNPYLFIFPPQAELATAHQADKIAARTATDTSISVTVIYEQGYEMSDNVRQTLSELDNREVAYRTFSYDFLSGRGIDSTMSRSLSEDRLNLVIIPSMSEAFITDALRNLNLIKSSYDYRIEVYGMSRWKSFETIEQNYFHALDLRLALSYYIDYNNPETIEFINRYRAAFNTEPSSFAFQGYDILTFFVKAMSGYGKDFTSRITGERKSLLQSDVLFLPSATGSGYVNRAFKDICFTKNWEVLTECSVR